MVFHNFRNARPRLTAIYAAYSCYNSATPKPITALLNINQINAFARTETSCVQHASLHITQPAEGVYAISAAQVLEARIVKALGTVAQLVVDDPAYVPVFERLEQELDNIQSRNDAIERARKYLPPSS